MNAKTIEIPCPNSKVVKESEVILDRRKSLSAANDPFRTEEPFWDYSDYSRKFYAKCIDKEIVLADTTSLSLKEILMFRLAAALLLLTSAVYGQHRVDPRNSYFRVIAVVPLTAGRGTPDDPKRPLYAPWPPSRSNTGIIAYSQQLSDDGKLALVEFVARDRAAFQPIFNDRSIKFFEKGKARRQDIETELKKYKKNFDLNKFGTMVP
ncbi:MAG: hypothetical protein C5B51_03890 [Terriglobia bacterium]|nr:MAG: hypothetical protein C5B51_03890 [Terriglobia bacterium]